MMNPEYLEGGKSDNGTCGERAQGNRDVAVVIQRCETEDGLEGRVDSGLIVVLAEQGQWGRCNRILELILPAIGDHCRSKSY